MDDQLNIIKTDNVVKMKLGILLVLCSVLVVASHDADGFIEIKKYKVINSDYVCGDKLCSPLDEQKAKKGLSTKTFFSLEGMDGTTCTMLRLA
ncbi:MAG: hypothetical protein HZC29_03335 [Thaumarchaeota archaeon]|nr:hypothetical protein [Nitrososphaerota archaeon]